MGRVLLHFMQFSVIVAMLAFLVTLVALFYPL